MRKTGYGKMVTIEVLEGELELDKVVVGDEEFADEDIRLASGDSVEMSF